MPEAGKRPARPDKAGIPFVDLARQYASIRREILEATDRICSGSQFILGSDLKQFEREFAGIAGTRHAVGVGSGTGALLLSLVACGLGKGDEVVVPANTFASSVFAISHCGAKPVLVDIDPRTYLMDTDALADVVGRRTRAIMPVHLYGQVADMSGIRRLARKHGLKIIEDACQAHGATHGGRPAGSLGDIAAFSFYPGKNLGAYGDGGAVTTGRRSLADRVRELRHIGQKSKNVHRVVGFNDRLDNLQAAFLRVKLGRLRSWNARRRRSARLYSRLLKKTPLTLPVEADENQHVYHLYVVRAPRRDDLARFLRGRGIATGIHYPKPIHLQPCYRHLGYPRGSFPHSEKASKEILSLPMFPEMTPREVMTVCEAIGAFYGTG